ncbi:hypothetical protein JTE90_010159 [Oedothorax gibbosus]|uniref:DUF4371 domain-containing protein n=1 Tax=Oedothorax gibbosus TaxID=931172 RepID=A0AAV6TVD5_9ARAC|nr:hypothetical protein JTE90_010159 [Oedothorax gibbosus]
MMKHSETKIHKRNLSQFQMQPTFDKYISENDKLKQLETSICSFIVEHDLPISFVEPLSKFCKALPEKSVVKQLQLGKQKATNIIRQGLRPHFNRKLRDELNNNFFSVFIDETTDVSSNSMLGIVITYYSLAECCTKVDVLDVVQLGDWTADAIYQAMIGVLKENNVPLHNWVGFCADTTNVMMGLNNSVSQRVKENFPTVIIVKCSCHSIHLVSSYACKKLPSSLEDLVRTIYVHLKRSPKRQKGFEEFQKFFNEEQNPKNFLAPGQTRWLSLQNCVRRILEYWEALKHYWQLITFEDKTHANELTYSTLKNPLMKCMMEFVEYALGLFNDFNTFFQSDAPNFSNLKTEVTRLLKTLGLNFMDPKYIRNTEDY